MLGDPDMPLAQVAQHTAIRTHLQGVLDMLARRSTGSSTFIARAVILPDEPSAAAGEVTDKGSIGQRATLANRRNLVEALYDTPELVGALTAAAPGGGTARRALAG